ncbi:MAG: crossover junction endodeoxyribonuclease RuvC [Bacteroidota bacterium]
MIILGVDPGTLFTGYGVIEGKKGKFRVLEFDVVKNRSNEKMPIRLRAIYSTLCRIINRYHPDEFAIETAFYGKNAQSAMKLGHARGVSILAAVNHEIPTTEYSPREVKRAVVGNGAASKDQVSYMVQSILKLRAAPRFYDATDALAVAICHYNRTAGNGRSGKKPSSSKKTSGNWKSFIEAHPERIVKHP